MKGTFVHNSHGPFSPLNVQLHLATESRAGHMKTPTPVDYRHIREIGLIGLGGRLNVTRRDLNNSE